MAMRSGVDVASVENPENCGLASAVDAGSETPISAAAARANPIFLMLLLPG